MPQPFTQPPPNVSYHVFVAGRWRRLRGPVAAAARAANELLSSGSVRIRVQNAKDEAKVILNLCQRVEENLRGQGISDPVNAENLPNGEYLISRAQPQL